MADMGIDTNGGDFAKTLDSIRAHALSMRRHALRMAKAAGGSASHFGGSMSMIEILATLYFGIMNTARLGMDDPARDRLILSKGHGAMGYYAALIEAGFMSESECEDFEQDFKALPGHPVMNREKGIEFTCGSLGMGLSIGVGLSIACRKKGLKNRVFVILGDGECDEGSVWEAFMAGAQFGLSNLTAIIDKNGFQLGGRTSDIMRMDNLAERISSFGWDTAECDGHDIEALYKALSVSEERAGKFADSEADGAMDGIAESSAFRDGSGRPLAIIANTVKGKGFSFSEGNNAWHHAILSDSQYETALEELSSDLGSVEK
ncbi:MAG: transketolase [Lachnospiraceae bacterium]|nr:transketolase [Lachnospiraceae bacterium]